MILDVRSPEHDGKHRQIYDADGHPIDYVVWCNTETGECGTLKFVTVPNSGGGAHYEIGVNESGDGAALNVNTYKAPLRWEFV